MKVQAFKKGLEDIQTELEIIRNTKEPKLIVKDRGIEALNFNDVEAAVGHIDCYLREEVIHQLVQSIAKNLKGQPKIPGFVVAYKGGEFMFRGFTDAYQLIGFLQVNGSNINKQVMKEAVINLPADKFTEHENYIEPLMEAAHGKGAPDPEQDKKLQG